MMYQLVLQWPASSIDDYDTMISVEDSLIEGLSDEAEVDGHDGGSGEVNIFVLAHEPAKLFERIKAILNDCGVWSDVRIAYRCVEGNDYTILWPKNLRKFEVR
jgi:hypothetical protein